MNNFSFHLCKVLIPPVRDTNMPDLHTSEVEDPGATSDVILK